MKQDIHIVDIREKKKICITKKNLEIGYIQTELYSHGHFH